VATPEPTPRTGKCPASPVEFVPQTGASRQ
jgi:hypothetical protein